MFEYFLTKYARRFMFCALLNTDFFDYIFGSIMLTESVLISMILFI